MTPPFGNRDVDEVVAPCPLKRSEKPLHWVEIELVGEDGEPIPWEEYLLVLPDGERISGFLDDEGFARAEGFVAGGDCQISFPGLDKDAWEKFEVLPMKEGR